MPLLIQYSQCLQLGPRGGPAGAAELLAGRIAVEIPVDGSILVLRARLGCMMLTDTELASLMTGLEREWVERKASASDLDEIRKDLCAFANDLADHRRTGVVFVGVNDDGTCAGLTIDDALLRRLGDMRDTVLPLPMLAVDHRHLNNCDVAVIQVEPSPNPPVRVRGRTWVRVGPTLRTATVEEEARLSEKRRWGNLPFDHTPMRGASVDDLDLDLFRSVYLPSAIAPEVLQDNQRDLSHQLSSLRLITSEAIPTVAGILTLGKDLRQWLPGAYIQFARYAGEKLTDAVADQKELDGPLPWLLRLVDDTLSVHIMTSSRITGQPLEVRQPDYPVEALRQLIRNAVMHRTYDASNAPVRLYWFSDRVEVLSPGGPFGIVNRTNFGAPGIADYRNPLVAEALKVLGYVQRFGAGIAIARSELARNGNPPPEFAVEPTHVLAIVRSRT
ncbi:MAG: RNA-binding domain-containing protein [Pirellulales bacterium]